MRYELIEAEDVFDNDNDGYKHGIYWFDNNDQIVHVEWFKTDAERYEDIAKNKDAREYNHA